MAQAADKEQIIDELLNRGVVDVVERGHLEQALKSGRELRVKLGIDPTSPDLHLGHAVPLWKLRAFQNLGHKAILIIGDFTARVGDPSGREDARKPLTEEEISRNMKEYLAQAGRILDLDKAEVRHNSEWLAHLGLKDITKLLGAATAGQILKREDFAKRLAEGSDIGMFETFYPLLQGYDSVAVKADVELGGQDQLLNLLMGRKVQRHYGMPEQDILTTPLLVGLDGKKKMSKSLGNVIGLTDEPDDMFGKIMSLPDNLMDDYFVLAAGVAADTDKDLHPKERKMSLARKVIARYHGERVAENAAEKWDKKFSKGETGPDILETRSIQSGQSAAGTVATLAEGMSKSEARRLIEQGGLEIEGEKIIDPDKKLSREELDGKTIRVGKKTLFRAKATD